MKADYSGFLKKAKNFKILVVGDFILDVYLRGHCTRLAPEASIPVVDIMAKDYCLGGSANAAANLSSLGAEVYYCTVMGNDDAAKKGIELLNQSGAKTDLIITDPNRNTIVKTRVQAPSHTIVRFDEGTENLLDSHAEGELIDRLHRAYFQCDAVLIADYDKGVLTPTVIAELKKLKLMENKFIAVDSKRLETFYQLSPSLIKPNYEEAIKMLSLPRTSQSRVEQLKPYGTHFQKKSNAELIALTLDEDGAMFFHQGNFVHHSPAIKVKDPNVSGAGDTFISALLLAMLTGANVPIASEMASAAASIAISSTQTGICTAKELTEFFSTGEKSTSITQLEDRLNQLKMSGKKIIFTNGCFDILHSGHVNYLAKAKEMGDVLIVGMNNDDSIKRLKGADRPINNLKHRMEVVSALSCVDFVIPFGSTKDDTPISLLKKVKPSVFVKGGDYKNKFLPEESVLKKMGCEIAFIPFVFDQSTTKIISKVKGNGAGHLKIAAIN